MCKKALATTKTITKTPERPIQKTAPRTTNEPIARGLGGYILRMRSRDPTKKPPRHKKPTARQKPKKAALTRKPRRDPTEAWAKHENGSPKLRTCAVGGDGGNRASPEHPGARGQRPTGALAQPRVKASD